MKNWTSTKTAGVDPGQRITPAFQPRQREKTAPCQAGCVNCGDIRGWIGAVAQRRKLGFARKEAYAQAWRLITEFNPFPATLGRICPHPCENHCNRAEHDEPLAINAMERFLGDFGVKEGLSFSKTGDGQAQERIGVVGAGPSGLSFAYQMARRGYRVSIYDAREKTGGMLRYGVPDFRLPQDVLDSEIRRIINLGIDLQMNTRVGKDISLDELRFRHDYVFLGIGAEKGRSLPIPGATGRSVWMGTDFLARINGGEAIDTGQQVIVIGGGNTAIDAARCARRGGADVRVLYRRTRQEMPAIEEEVQDALEEGVEFSFLSIAVEIKHGDEGELTGIKIQRTSPGQPDASGRRKPLPVPGTEKEVSADTVIIAISQVPALEGLETLAHQGDWLVANPEGVLQGGLLTGGDAMGLGVAGNAIAHGRHAAEVLHAKLRGLEYPQSVETIQAEVGPDRILFESKPECQAVHTKKLPVQDRIGFGMKEVENTISEEEFLNEVERCFSCGSCSGCEQCFMYCTEGCFSRVEEPSSGNYFNLNPDTCHECGKCIEVCPCDYLEIR